MLYCPNFFWNVLQVWMTGKDVYLQMTWSWPDKTWNILCSYCLQWNTSQSKFRNHYFLFLFAFSILSQLFLIWGCKSANRLNSTLCQQVALMKEQWYDKSDKSSRGKKCSRNFSQASSLQKYIQINPHRNIYIFHPIVRITVSLLCLYNIFFVRVCSF